MSREDLTESDISKILGQEGLFVLPDGAKEIINSKNPESLMESITNTYNEGTQIGIKEVEEVKNNTDSNRKEGKKRIDPENALDKMKKNIGSTSEERGKVNRKETLNERYPDLCNIMFERELPEAKDRVEYNGEYEIIGDITGKSRCEGDFEDFEKLFNSRYDKMVDLLDKRVGGLYHVSDLDPRRHGGEGMTVVGMVWSKFVSKNDNYFIDIEDPKTNELMRVGWTDDWIKDSFEEVIEDEVIAIRGNLADDGDIIWGDDEIRRGRPPIMFPDVPRRKSKDTTDKDIKAALISDIHVGSDEFRPKKWNKFVDWIRKNPKVCYVFIAGDLAEGIGVYPDQDEELTVLDIYDQYAMTGKMFDQIPNDVEIFASVGNHDTVRLAEPQPTIPEKFQTYFPDNVNFLGNPVTVDINGVSVLMYHGMSIYDISEVLPGYNAEEPIPIMKMMLKKRHLAPIYGKNVRLAPENEDYLVIDELPDVLHSGHVHKYGKDTYNGIKITNTATWQGQTNFQKSKGIDPDVGYWSVLDLSRIHLDRMNTASVVDD